jgi:hypothetical protein
MGVAAHRSKRVTDARRCGIESDNGFMLRAISAARQPEKRGWAAKSHGAAATKTNRKDAENAERAISHNPHRGFCDPLAPQFIAGFGPGEYFPNRFNGLSRNR